MKHFNDAPVAKEKIQLITDLLKSQPVNKLWLEMCACPAVEPDTGRSLREHKHNLWKQYCKARDAFLGLPPLVAVQIKNEGNSKQ